MSQTDTWENYEFTGNCIISHFVFSNNKLPIYFTYKLEMLYTLYNYAVHVSMVIIEKHIHVV